MRKPTPLKHGSHMAEKLAADSADSQAALHRTAAWWQAFWGRSWVFASGDGGVDIPANKHPLRIGIDSNGQNLLPGYLGRTGVYSRALTAKEIAMSRKSDAKRHG